MESRKETLMEQAVRLGVEKFMLSDYLDEIERLREEVARQGDAPAELRQIHDVVMCIGCVTEAPETDPYTLRAVKQMALRITAAMAKSSETKVVTWQHILHLDFEQCIVEYTESPEHPFGQAGRDYSDDYYVTSYPLVRAELVKASALKISPDGEVLPVRANREGKS